MRRVVVTGMGMVSPLGVGVDYNWSALTSGKSGLKKIPYFDASDLTSQIGGIIPHAENPKDCTPENGLYHHENVVPAKEIKKMDDFIVYGIAAAREAILDSGWKPDNEEEFERSGVLIGAGIGGLTRIFETSEVLLEKGPRRISPFFIPSALINLVSGHVSIEHGYKGPNHSVVTACATGTHAIGDASRLIMFGDADVMVAGGAEASINRIGVGGFAAARALSTSYNDTPEIASRPFDEGRDGFVIGEGSGIVVLEEYEHAKARGAKIYAEVMGYGLSGDAYHITSPAADGNGGFRAMKGALRNARMNTSEIDYINAHGTSTPLGDSIECGAVKRLFANDLNNISMSSTKSSIGHLLGAAGAVEAIYSIKALQNNLMPPTLNLENISESCEGVDLVPLKAKEKPLNAALSNSFGFGGTNASIIFTKV